MKIILLTQGYQALVDDEDFDWVNQWNWYTKIHKNRKNPVPYAIRKINKITVSMAVEIAKKHGIWLPGHEIDHRDANRLNNQRSNLRPATGAQNQANQVPRSGSSKYKGVSWNPVTEKWRAQIGFNYKKHKLGEYRTEEEAAKVYDLCALHLFGEYARLNFPQ